MVTLHATNVSDCNTLVSKYLFVLLLNSKHKKKKEREREFFISKRLRIAVFTDRIPDCVAKIDYTKYNHHFIVITDFKEQETNH